MSFMRGCEFNHTNMEMAGVYKRNKYGQIKKDSKGNKIYLEPHEVWACPYCRLVFLKPPRKRWRELQKKLKNHGKFNNRTVPKVSCKHPKHHPRIAK